MRKTCLHAIYELARLDRRVVFIGSDLGADTLNPFKEEMSERFFMEGVGESYIVGMAAGLAMEGKIPFVNTIATFLTRRAYEQIAVDLCHQNLKVRLIGNGGGLVYAPLGMTHQAVEDIALMRALPNMTVVAPADAREMSKIMIESMQYPSPLYIRLAKGYEPIVTHEKQEFKFGKAYQYFDGEDALVITTGVTLQPALQAVKSLAEKSGINAKILHCPTIKPLDKRAILAAIEQTPVVVVVEEHTPHGGLASAVAEIMVEAAFVGKKHFCRIGIPDTFPDDFGSQASLMQRYGITAKNIFFKVWQAVDNNVVQIITSENIMTPKTPSKL